MLLLVPSRNANNAFLSTTKEINPARVENVYEVSMFFCEYIPPFLFILSNGGAFPLFDQFQTGEKNIEKWGRERFLVVINGVARRFIYGRFCSVRANFGNHA